MENVEQTIISQYANSPTLVQLIQNFNGYIDPSANIDAFYDLVWNLDTAQGKGLDIWGKIVGLENGRLLTIPSTDQYFGFQDAGALTFGEGVFYDGTPATQTYSLADGPFLTLILAKAIANISDGSIGSINRLLQNLFAGRGRCYVNDLGSMQMRYTFEFYLEPYEVAIVTQSGVLPVPTGVLASMVQIPMGSTFGFQEAGAATFGEGTFFNGALPVS
ncbi:DUF2612 domain-containing protein [Pararobbsia alpina]|uniref:DUF2612 domain-containing protein n=1 Tax=Pararobbsia alpina TaxID=621374 RepID=UPI0039A583FC